MTALVDRRYPGSGRQLRDARAGAIGATEWRHYCPRLRIGGASCLFNFQFVSVAMDLTKRVHPNRLERGKPLGTRRPAPPRVPCHGPRLVSVRVRFSPCRQVTPSARRNTLASARPPSL